MVQTAQLNDMDGTAMPPDLKNTRSDVKWINKEPRKEATTTREN